MSACSLMGASTFCRERNCSHIVCAHVIKSRDRIGRIATLRNGNVERMLWIGVFKIDEGLGRHNGHLHLQRIFAGNRGCNPQHGATNPKQRCAVRQKNRTGKYQRAALPAQTNARGSPHTHMGKLNVIEHLHRLTSLQIISI